MDNLIQQDQMPRQPQPRSKEQLLNMLRELEIFYQDAFSFGGRVVYEDQVYIDASAIPVLILFPEYREKFLKALEQYLTDVKTLDFGTEEMEHENELVVEVGLGLGRFVGELMASQLMTDNDLTSAGQSIGKSLGRLFKLDYLTIDSFHPILAPFFASAVRHCRDLKTLAVNVGHVRTDAMALLPFARALEDHAFIEHVTVYRSTENLLPMLSSFLARLPSLVSCSLQSCGATDSPRIESRAHATALRNICTIPSLTELKLEGCGFVNVEAAETVCSGLARVRLKRLTVRECTFPVGHESLLVNMLAQASLVELRYFPPHDGWDNHDSARAAAYMSAFVPGLRYIKGLRSLTLNCRPLDDQSIGSIFRHAHSWNIQELTLLSDKFEHETETRLSEYIAKNESLRKFTLKAALFFQGPPIVSAALLAAVDSGARCLEEIIFDSAELVTMVDTDWHARLQHYLNLNRQRHRLDPGFMTLTRMEVEFLQRLLFTEAIETMDLEVLFEFLRRNEWNLPIFLQRFGKREDE